MRRRTARVVDIGEFPEVRVVVEDVDDDLVDAMEEVVVDLAVDMQLELVNVETCPRVVGCYVSRVVATRRRTSIVIWMCLMLKWC